jgi:glycosyltransferase involved in cell wall biosynthesis
LLSSRLDFGAMSKFLFVATNDNFPWGACEHLWSQAAELLSRRGHDIRASVKDWGNPLEGAEHLRTAGCRLFYRKPPSFLVRQTRRVIPGFADGRSHLRSIGADADLVVISQGSNTDGLGWMEAASVAGLRYATISHSSVVYWWPEDGVAERLAAGYEHAAASYFVSQANIDASRLQFATPLRHAKIVRNPFNVRYDARLLWPEDSSADLTLACVARLDVISKGQDLLLQVLALPHWRERKVRVSLVGTGPNERVLRHIAAQFGLTNATFLGHQADIEKMWSSHQALVLPSRFEGMPLTVVEAMLCGRPCIVTDVGGNRELVRDGINGFIAKAPTIELFDEAMNRAWESRGRLKEMGERAAADVREWVPADPVENFVRELETLTQ